LLLKTRQRARAYIVASVSSGALIAGIGLALVAGRVAADGTASGPSTAVTVDITPAINDIALQQRERAATSGAGQTTMAQALSTSPTATPAETPVVAIATPATTPTVVTPDPAELECLTAAVYYEARGEAEDGQAAVAQVVLNRVGQARFAKTVCGVVYQGAKTHACQFSFTCHGRPSRVREAAAWTRSRAIAQRALSGYVMRTVGHATYFHVASLDLARGSHEPAMVRLGHHIFYASVHRQELRRAYRTLESNAKSTASPPAVGQSSRHQQWDRARGVLTAVNWRPLRPRDVQFGALSTARGGVKSGLAVSFWGESPCLFAALRLWCCLDSASRDAPPLFEAPRRSSKSPRCRQAPRSTPTTASRAKRRRATSACRARTISTSRFRSTAMSRRLCT
jgi:spore germination cell wall hydrolase CwlJ-like protein